MEEFHMKRKKLHRSTILIIGLCILALVSALKYIPKKDLSSENIKETSAVNTPEVIYLEKNSAIKLKTVYSCGHIKNETRETDKDLIGKTKDEVMEIHPNWKITKFEKNLLCAEESIEAPCDNHYLIKLKNDTLYVYKKNNTSESIREQKINTAALADADIKELTAGIDAETEFEVLEILESFVS